MHTGPILGRRDRNKAAKKDAIIQAATELFGEYGYAGTTTQQVAQKANVADGTLFRYAGSKPELLLMVINERLRPLVAAASAGALPVENAILEMLSPLIDLADSQPANAGPFLREVLFGEDGQHRRESLQLVDQLVARIAEAMAPMEDQIHDMGLHEAAGWVFSVLVMALLQDVVRGPAGDRHAALTARVRVLLRGLGLSAPH